MTTKKGRLFLGILNFYVSRGSEPVFPAVPYAGCVFVACDVLGAVVAAVFVVFAFACER